MTPDPDAPARRSLAWHRAIATAMLAGMAGLALATYAMPAGWGTDLLQAAAKAGFVGGVADWFAVTALFRRPLGLPIPHTAIIPAQKERLGRALGRFVANHVFTEHDVGQIIDRLDLAGILRRFLTDPANARPASQALAQFLPRLLGTIEDGRARRIAQRLLPHMLGGAGAGRVVARALRGLVAGGRHQEMLDFILGQMKQLLARQEDTLRRTIEERVREQGGRLVGWALGASIARRVLGTLNAELEKIGPDGSDLRAAFDAWIMQEIVRMEEDPARAAEIGAAIRRVVAHESVQSWIWDVWARLRLALEVDAVLPNGRSVAFLEGALGNLGVLLDTDPGARARLQGAAQAVVSRLLPAAQAQLSDFIAGVVGNWDTATIVERLELRVGRDLQYVRMNGTLVGFLVGGLVYAVLHATFGHVSF